MSLDVFLEKGVPLDRQKFTWKEMAGPNYSKLNDDAFTRVRVILMNGIEAEAVRFSHAVARYDGRLRGPLARVRRIEHHQNTLVNWMNPPDQTPLETTIGYEQNAIEVTAAVAQHEPDPYLASVYRFGMLEDFDHLYRFSALMDRVEGRDSNNLLQSYTDIRPGRPTLVEHRDPMDDLREHYDRTRAGALTKLHALTIVAAEHQVRDYYMNIGPVFTDPVARMLYAEIASIEEQHVTQYESIMDPGETPLEKWLLHEATEVYNYWSCLQQESNPYVKSIWDRFLAYELGHLHYVMDLMKELDHQDPAPLLARTLPDPIKFTSHREFVRKVLSEETDLRASGTQFISSDLEGGESLSAQYRKQLNLDGSPSETIAAGYIWTPGTELTERINNVQKQGGSLQ
jgi:rubrerythrin